MERGIHYKPIFLKKDPFNFKNDKNNGEFLQIGKN